MIVAEADVDVRADTSHVESELSTKMNAIAARVGDRVGTIIGKGMGRVIAADMRHTAEEAGEAGATASRRFSEGVERNSGGVARSGRLLANVLVSNSNTALRPLQEVIDRVEVLGDAMHETSTRAGGVLIGVGAAVTGVGALLSTLSGREEAAAKRLDVAINNSGGIVEDFTARIDEAVKSGRRFGDSGTETLDALNKLTLGLGSPKKALDNLGLAQDIAAARGVKLATAAEMVRQIYAGSPEALRQFGIAAGEVVDVQKNLTKAQRDNEAAVKSVTTAQQTFTDKLAIYRDTVHPTLSQQMELWKAHNKLVEAQQRSKTAAQELTTAQKASTQAAAKGDQQLALVAARMRGEAAAAADTFTGRLKGVGATIEDNAAKLGGKFGDALIKVGPLLAGVGLLIESGIIGKIGRAVGAMLGMSGTAVATAATEVAAEATVATAAEATAAAVSTIGPAAGIAAGEVGVATAAMDAELAATAAAGEAATASIGASFLALLGPIAVVTAAAGTFFALGKYEHDHPRGFTGAALRNNPVWNKIFGKPKHIDSPFDHSLEDTPGLHPHTLDRDLDPAQDAKDAAHATAKGRLIGDAVAKGVKSAKPQTFDDFLKQMGIDKASAKADAAAKAAKERADKALKELQKKAAERARELGEQVTQSLHNQLDKVSAQFDAVKKQRDKIVDFRGSVLSAVSSFTKLSGLIDDPSTASASRITSALSNRLLGLQTFARNLQTLAKRGLDRGVIAELAAGGPQERALSSALVAGSAQDIAQVNATEKAIRAQAQFAAKVGTDAAFGAGAIEKSNRELAALNVKMTRLNKQIDAQPALIAKAVEAAQKNAKVSTSTSTRTAVAK